MLMGQASELKVPSELTSSKVSCCLLVESVGLVKDQFPVELTRA